MGYFSKTWGRIKGLICLDKPQIPYSTPDLVHIGDSAALAWLLVMTQMSRKPRQQDLTMRSPASFKKNQTSASQLWTSAPVLPETHSPLFKMVSVLWSSEEPLPCLLDCILSLLLGIRGERAHAQPSSEESLSFEIFPLPVSMRGRVLPYAWQPGS